MSKNNSARGSNFNDIFSDLGMIQQEEKAKQVVKTNTQNTSSSKTTKAASIYNSKQKTKNKPNASSDSSIIFYIPKDTFSELKKIKFQCDNAALKISKYIKGKKYIKDKKHIENNSNTDNKEEYSIDKINEAIEIKNAARNILKIVNDEQKNVFNSIRSGIKKEFEKMLASSMVLGLGGSSVFETSITMHHTYAVPYIPASSIKGAFRGFIIKEYYTDENAALKDGSFSEIFGSAGKLPNKGDVVFFDAYPKMITRIEVDILNPHFVKYYNGGSSWPTDSDNPIPVKFYVVPSGTIFCFRYIHLKKSSQFIQGHTLEHIFEKFLSYQGLGAKTSVGYGVFYE